MKTVILFLLVIFCLPRIFFSQGVSSYSKLHFTSKEENRVSINSIYSYHFSAADSPGHPFYFSIKTLPFWIQYDSIRHTLSGNPPGPGQYAIHIIASGTDTVIHQQFMLTVYNSNTTNILCLGNSITNGTDRYNSYRRHLWMLLHQNKYNIDMVGSWSSHHMGGGVPDPDFDMDHDGHSGWTAANVLNPPDWDKQRGNIHDWLKDYSPDIVLLELGTNEVFQCTAVNEAIKNISDVIDTLRNNNPGVKIFLAQIPPLGKQWSFKKLCGNDIDYAQKVIEFNKAIKIFAGKQNKVASAIIIVDQFTGIDPAKNMYDDIHPNDSGEKIMAERWFKAIRPYLKKL